MKAANHVARKIRHDDLFKMPVCKMVDDSKQTSGFWFIQIDLLFLLLYYIYVCVCCQCLETLTGRQMDMQLFIADGCKEALLEEKRRFCFLVDKHCMLSYQIASFHDKVQNNQAEHFARPWLNNSQAVVCRCGGEKLIHRKPSTISDLFKTPTRALYSKTHNLRNLNASCYHGDENLCVVFLLITHVFF